MTSPELPVLGPIKPGEQEFSTSLPTELELAAMALCTLKDERTAELEETEEQIAQLTSERDEIMLEIVNIGRTIKIIEES